MNYIKKLEAQNKLLNDFKQELYQYIISDKFNGINLQDKMVNRNDILLRIHELEDELFTEGL